MNNYIKIGDIVKDGPNSIWGDKLFTVHYLHGNDYLPLASTTFYGKERSISNAVLFDARQLKLMGAEKRPLQKLPKKTLIKIMNKNIEAKREFMIRINNKIL